MKRFGFTVVGALLLAFSLQAAAGDRGHDRLRDSYRAGHHHQSYQHPAVRYHRHHKASPRWHHQRKYQRHAIPRVQHHYHYYQRGPAYYPHPLPRYRSGLNGHVTIHF